MAADGSVREWIGALTDIHEKKVAAETQHTLVLELQHRVRNSLAVCRSLSVQTAATPAMSTTSCSGSTAASPPWPTPTGC